MAYVMVGIASCDLWEAKPGRRCDLCDKDDRALMQIEGPEERESIRICRSCLLDLAAALDIPS